MKSIEFYIRVKQPVIKWVTDDEGIHHIVETGEYTEELELRRMPYTEANEAIAKAEAYNGEYTIEDDGQHITAPHNIMAGEYVTIDGVLYMATQNIPNGEPVIVGQNAIATTVEAQLLELKGE